MNILKTNTLLGRSLQILGFLCFTGCQLNPPCCELRNLPENALEIAKQEALSDPTYIEGDWLDENWWCLFKDEQLDQLIEQALVNNPSITKAEIRVKSALALKKQATSPLFPTLDAQGDITRIRNSKNGLLGLLTGFTLPNGKVIPLAYTQPEATLNFNYEFDFWKKHYNQLIASIDEVKAREAEKYQADLIISLSVARSYFELQIARAREELARQLIDNNGDLISLQEMLLARKLVNEFSLISARQNLLNFQQFKIQISQNLSTSSHELQALIADDFDTPVYPKNVDLGCNEPFPLPSCIPLDLLAHRPDIWAQCWRVAAAGRLVSAAKAEFYPNINLAAFIGLQTITPGNFFQRDSLYWAYGPAIHLPIFRGGALQAQYDGRVEDYHYAIAEYDSMVLNAVREVLDALDAVRLTTDYYNQAKFIAEEEKKAYELAILRNQNRLNSKLDILAYKNAWIETSDSSLQALLATLNARLALIRALGGMQKNEF